MRSKSLDALACVVMFVAAACSGSGGRLAVRPAGAGTGGAGPTNDQPALAGSQAQQDDARTYIVTPSPELGPSGVAGSGLKEGQCAARRIVTTRVVPTVWLVLDGSGSMVQPLGDRARWTALREALMDPSDGVVKSLNQQVAWGLLVYDGATPGNFVQPLPDGGAPMFSAEPATTCPRVVTVPPKQNNYADIDAAYALQPLGGSTPTDQALRALIDQLPNTQAQLDAHVGPTIVVLATDGEPNNLCALDFAAPDVQGNVVNVVRELASAEVKTYVISLAGDNQALTQHLEQVAAAGMTGKTPFLPTNKAELVQTFQEIIGPAVTCEVALTGSVKVGSECTGQIMFNGKPLRCDDPNGWALKDASTISIMGAACEDYLTNQTAILEADFPCEAIDIK